MGRNPAHLKCKHGSVRANCSSIWLRISRTLGEDTAITNQQHSFHGLSFPTLSKSYSALAHRRAYAWRFWRPNHLSYSGVQYAGQEKALYQTLDFLAFLVNPLSAELREQCSSAVIAPHGVQWECFAREGKKRKVGQGVLAATTIPPSSRSGVLGIEIMYVFSLIRAAALMFLCGRQQSRNAMDAGWGHFSFAVRREAIHS